jgi:hypothetical protein
LLMFMKVTDFTRILNGAWPVLAGKPGNVCSISMQ